MAALTASCHLVPRRSTEYPQVELLSLIIIIELLNETSARNVRKLGLIVCRLR